MGSVGGRRRWSALAILLLASLAALGSLASLWSSASDSRLNSSSPLLWLSVEAEGRIALVDTSVPDQAPLASHQVGSPGAGLDVLNVERGALVHNIEQSILYWAENATRTVDTIPVLLGSPPIEPAGRLVEGSGGHIWYVTATTARPIELNGQPYLGAGLPVGADPDLVIVDERGEPWLVETDGLRSLRDAVVIPMQNRSTVVSAAGGLVTMDPVDGIVRFLSSNRDCRFEVSPELMVEPSGDGVLLVDPRNGAVTTVAPDCEQIELFDVLGGDLRATARVGRWLVLLFDGSSDAVVVDIEQPGSAVRVGGESMSADNDVELLVAGGNIVFHEPSNGSFEVLDPTSGTIDVQVIRSSAQAFRCELSDVRLAIDATATAFVVDAASGDQVRPDAWFIDGVAATGEGDGRLPITASEAGEVVVTFVIDEIEYACPNLRFTDLPPQTVLVDPNGGGDFTSLPLAVSTLAPGSAIELAAGEHRLDVGLTIDYDLVIRSQGDRATIVAAGDDGGLIIRLATVTIEAVDIVASGTSSADAVVGIDDADASIVDVLVSGGAQHGVRVSGGSATITGSQVNDNELTGVIATSSSVVTIAGSSASGNGGHGYWWRDGAGGTIEASEAEDNGTYGFVFEDSEVSVIGNRSVGNANGFGWLEGASVRASGNGATENDDFGFFFGGSAAAEVSDNTATANRGTGYYFSGVSGGDVTGNVAEANNKIGFYLERSDRLLLQGNTATGNGQEGFRWFAATANEAKSNSAVANQLHGYAYDSSSVVALDGNDATANGEYGYLVAEQLPDTNSHSDNGQLVGVAVFDS